MANLSVGIVLKYPRQLNYSLNEKQTEKMVPLKPKLLLHVMTPVIDQVILHG
jgi:hypothetical protein